MATNPDKKPTMAQRRRQVSKLWLSRIGVTEIAEQLKTPEKTIRNDIKALTALWQQQAVEDMGRHMERDLAVLADMERDCVLGFAARKTRGWLTTRLDILERRAKMLGLDAPAQHELAGRGGGPIETREVHDLSGLTDEEVERAVAEADRIVKNNQHSLS